MVAHSPELIVPIAATPDLLETHKNYREQSDYQFHQVELAGLVQAHGCLVFDSWDSVEEFDKAVEAIDDPSTKEAWRFTRDFGRARLCDRGDALPKKLRSEQALASWSAWAGLACVSEQDWSELANPDELETGLAIIPRKAGPKTPRSIEAAFTRMANLREVGALAAARKLSSKEFSAGTDRADLRRQFYRPLLRYSVSVAIFDRYLGENVLDWNREDDGKDGLEWLLGLVHADTMPVISNGAPQGTVVDIYTTFVTKDFETNFEQLDAKLREITDDIWTKGNRAENPLRGLASVRLHCAPRKNLGGNHLLSKPRIIAFGHGAQKFGEFGRNRTHGLPTDQRLVSFLRLEDGLKSLGGPTTKTDFAQSFYSMGSDHVEDHGVVFRRLTQNQSNFERVGFVHYEPELRSDDQREEQPATAADGR